MVIQREVYAAWRAECAKADILMDENHATKKVARKRGRHRIYTDEQRKEHIRQRNKKAWAKKKAALSATNTENGTNQNILTK